MKKAAAISLIVLTGILYFVSNSANLTEAFSEIRSRSKVFAVAHRGHGDLYNMTFISDYRSPLTYDPKPVRSPERKIRLFLICDSYLMGHVQKEHFFSADTLIRIKWWDDPGYIEMPRADSSQNNILIIELAERFIRDACSDIATMTAPIRIQTSSTHDPGDGINVNAGEMKQADKPEPFFNPNINSNLELNLFGYTFFNPLKEIKGDLTYKWLKRKSPDVYIDESHHFLFYKPTVSGDQHMNSFYPVDSTEINKIVQTLIGTRAHFLQHGFKEVYFAFVPNPVSVVHPGLGTYNQLVPLLTERGSGHFPAIDVYGIFKNDPEKFYANNDSHWNSEGLQRWLDETNRLLEKFLLEHP
ncbi:MAG: hypothetical protein JNL88_12500 [Bacteroidia bacterium]|nr:hypothetical protein [Bacteroidia bacterium]